MIILHEGGSMKKEWLVKTFAIVIVLLLVGVTIAQGINLNTKQLSLTKSNKNIISSKEKIKLSCCYFKLDGVEQVVKEVTVQDANYLSQLMNGSDDDAIVSELDRLNLLPKTVSVEQAKDLVSGRYGQKISEQSQKIFYLNQSMDTDWKENFNCNISGYGVDAYFMTPRMLILSYALYIGLDLIILPFAVPLFVLCFLFINNTKVFLFLLGLLTIIVSPLALVKSYIEMGQFINSFKFTPGRIVANLFDAVGDGNPYLNTSGRNGTWGFENDYRGIAMYMQGFYGIWLSILDYRQVPGANVKGYCSYIKAKGMDDWPWNGWGDDWPW